MGLIVDASSITEMWRLEDELQFRQIHTIGAGKFLLSGGLDCPTWPQTKLSCAFSVLDVRTRSFDWRMEQKRHKIFDYSCATLAQGIGVIPHKFKSDFCGILLFHLSSGNRDHEAIEVPNVKGVVPLSDASFAFVTWSESSHLWTSTEAGLTSTEISSDNNFRVASLVPFGNSNVVTVMQHSYLIDGKGRIAFVHQLRSLDGKVQWEYRSENDTCVKASDTELLLYSNASDQSKTQIEVLSATDGKLVDSFAISSSLANITPVTDRTFVFCNPRYDMCFFDRSKRKVERICSFPSDVPGWLCFAIDTENQLILGCKADNFVSPKSTIAVFTYAIE